MVTALVSSYREGSLLASCVRSLLVPCVTRVIVCEGPVGDGERSVENDVPPFAWHNAYVQLGHWDSDAHKRTAMLHLAKDFARERDKWLPSNPLWVLWLDADEVLLYGEYLQDWVTRAEKTTGAGGFPLRLVELNGSVVKCHGRAIRADLVDSYVHSIMDVQLNNRMIVSLPNVPICAAGGVPVWTDDTRQIEVDDLAELRPPVMGEPHILHRAVLRDPDRQARRMHEDEAAFYEQHAT